MILCLFPALRLKNALYIFLILSIRRRITPRFTAGGGSAVLGRPGGIPGLISPPSGITNSTKPAWSIP